MTNILIYSCKGLSRFDFDFLYQKRGRYIIKQSAGNSVSSNKPRILWQFLSETPRGKCCGTGAWVLLGLLNDTDCGIYSNEIGRILFSSVGPLYESHSLKRAFFWRGNTECTLDKSQPKSTGANGMNYISGRTSAKSASRFSDASAARYTVSDGKVSARRRSKSSTSIF